MDKPLLCKKTFNYKINRSFKGYNNENSVDV